MGMASAHKVETFVPPSAAKTAYIAPGSPWGNGYVESFNARLRDELLEGEIFLRGVRRKSSSKAGGVTSTQYARMPSLGYRALVPELCSRLPSPRGRLAPSIRSTGHAHIAGEANHKLTSQPNHSVGAGQVGQDNLNLSRARL